MEEICVTYKREIVRWSATTAVLECKFQSGGTVRVICDCEKGDLEPDIPYRFSGEYKYHKTYGQQFRSSLFVPDLPVTEMETRRYIQKYNGIGPVTAAKLWDKYGAKTLETLASTPEVLYSYKIKHATAKEISRLVAHDMENARTKIALANFLAGYHFPRSLTETVFKDYGAKAVQALTVNPYLLLQYDRCGFQSVDAFALDKGFNPFRLKRQALFLLDQMASSGDVWFTEHQMKTALNVQFNSNANCKTFELLLRAHKIRISPNGPATYAAAEPDAADEETITEEVTRHLIPNTEVQIDVSSLSDSQRESLLTATRLRIGCFTGGPGTGKTYSVARYIQAIVSRYGSGSVCVVAPTGKAVVRSKEMLASIGVSCDTRTIHSLLMAQESGLSSPSYGFIISDESSMIDASLMRRFLVQNRGASILFVGDDGQLLPVGKGRPFADFLASGVVPVGRLTETRRNSGQIVTACHAIRNDRFWSPSAVANIPAGENLVFVPSGNFLGTIQAILAKFPGVDLVKNIQVIAGVNKGDNGVIALNESLRPMMNPGCDLTARYDRRDPVICLKNGCYCDAEDRDNQNDEGTVYVSNGEIGQCVEVELDQTGAVKRVVVDFGNDRAIRFKPSNLHFSLAYAVTCHKMQGSETPIAIVLLDPAFSAKRVCTREWIYTAISRAKKLCFLVGNMETARAFCRHLGGDRKTFLAQDLQNYIQQEKEQINGNSEFSSTGPDEGPGRTRRTVEQDRCGNPAYSGADRRSPRGCEALERVA